MRENLFRGKRRDNGEWVYGSLFVGFKKSYICPEAIAMYNFDGALCLGGFVEVSPESVGQYTGLKDKHGKKIFEGDILLLDDIKGIVNYGTGCFCVKLPSPDYLYRNNPAIDMVLNEYPGLEIIGNIHDNPELLLESKEECNT